VGQFDVEAALRRHLAIPQTWDRRSNIKLYRYPGNIFLDKGQVFRRVALNQLWEVIRPKRGPAQGKGVRPELQGKVLNRGPSS
jgi:hypothetical protein